MNIHRTRSDRFEPRSTRTWSRWRPLRRTALRRCAWCCSRRRTSAASCSSRATKGARDESWRRTRGRRFSCTCPVGRSGSRGGSRKSPSRSRTITGRRAREARRSQRRSRTRASRSSRARSWSVCTPSSTLRIRQRSRGRRTGAVTASSRTSTSSGNTATTASTTGSATAATARAGRSNDCSRDYGFSVILGHLDLDAFFAAVEELENPDLRSKPLIVGGDPRGRGVVATANYEARKFGIGSAMSCAEALRRCPHAVFVRPRHSVYREYSGSVWSAVREVVPTVERTGLDEGYLDLGEVADTFGEARAVAEAVQTSVRGSTSLSVAIGVATSKVVAKIASDRRKPGGLTVVPPGREASFLAPFDIRRLPGVGPRSEARLRAAGLETIGALAALSDADLKRLLPGKVGLLLRDRARGIDPRPLETVTERISISTEETFERDIADRDRLKDEVHRMAVGLAEHLQRKGETARTVTTKVRYPDFAIRSRSTSLPVGTDDADRISELACKLLDRALDDRPGPLRLVGVGVSGFEPHRQLALV